MIIGRRSARENAREPAADGRAEGTVEVDWPGLREAAAAAAANAYAPYSGLRVGAAGLVSDGRVVAACNVENASYGLTLCAECGLVCALHASGGGTLAAVSVVAGDGQPLAPCGAAGSCCWRRAARACSSRQRMASAPSLTCCPARSAGVTWPPGVSGGRRGRPVPEAVELIRAKRDGRALADAEIRGLIEGYTAGQIAHEQMSALLMAIYFRGLNAAELRAWTAAMVSSGERLDLSPVAAPTVDKHSTGGVG